MTYNDKNSNHHTEQKNYDNFLNKSKSKIKNRMKPAQLRKINQDWDSDEDI